MERAVHDQLILSTLEQEGELKTWANHFITERHVRGLSPKSIQYYREMLGGFLSFCDGQVISHASQITPHLLRQYLLWLEQHGHNPGGVHGYFRAVRAFLNWMWDELEPAWGPNPILKVKSPKVPEELLEPADLDDIQKMLAVCEKRTFTGRRDEAILLCLLDTGARANEFLSIDLTDLGMKDLEDQTAPMDVILLRTTKGGRPRPVFLGNESRKALRAYLRRRKDQCPALWVTGGGYGAWRLTYDGLRSIMRRRAQLAGVPIPSLHSFRRAFCLAQLQARVPETAIARMMGHSNTTLIAKYAKQRPAHLHELYRSPVDTLLK